MQKRMHSVIGIIGPTASGKTKCGQEFARQARCKIINADSQQLYRGLDVLSCMPTLDDNHLLYSILNPEDRITVFQWAKLVNDEVKLAFKEGYQPVIVGGTGLYFKILRDGIANIPIVMDVEYSDVDVIKKLEECDPEVLTRYKDMRRRRRALSIYLKTGQSIFDYFSKNNSVFDFKIEIFSLMPDKAVLHNAIKMRVEEMFMNEDVLNEVKNFQYNQSFVLGFAEIKDYLRGGHDLTVVQNLIAAKTRQYAKRQTTFINNVIRPTNLFFDHKEMLSAIFKFIQ
jgi:tRNA dimethylallyltransferase